MLKFLRKLLVFRSFYSIKSLDTIYFWWYGTNKIFMKDFRQVQNSDALKNDSKYVGDFHMDDTSGNYNFYNYKNVLYTCKASVIEEEEKATIGFK